MILTVTCTRELSGWYALRFPYSPDHLAAIKTIPGRRWVPGKKAWMIPPDGLAAAQYTLKRFFHFQILSTNIPACVPNPAFTSALRPYQLEGMQKILKEPAFTLTYEMRTGKSFPTVAALGSMLANKFIHRALILFPSSVKDVWRKQLAQWGRGLTMKVVGNDVFTAPVGDLNARHGDLVRLFPAPYLVVGCPYEYWLENFGDSLLHLFSGSPPFAIVADELHFLQNRKAQRTIAAMKLAAQPNCVRRVGLTGTPMRNSPKNMYTFFTFLYPGEADFHGMEREEVADTDQEAKRLPAGGAGTYWQFSARYANGHKGEFGWEDDGASNEDELSVRLGAVTQRITRADARGFLPKTEHSVIICDAAAPFRRVYDAQERSMGGPQALESLSVDLGARDSAKLRVLTNLTAQNKLDTAVERLKFHVEQRGVKVVVFAHFHEHLKMLESKLSGIDPVTGEVNTAPDDEAGGEPVGPLNVPVFCAGGWKLPDKRASIIERWKAHKGPAVLLANIIASGMGIDLSAADTAIFFELWYVPGDFEQAKARLEDVHLGSRSTPPLYEYILVPHTIDTDMAYALIRKGRHIKAIGQSSVEQENSEEVFTQSGIVDRRNLPLDKQNEAAIDEVIHRMRARLMGEDTEDSDAAALAQELNEAFTEDAELDENSDDALEQAAS